MRIPQDQSEYFQRETHSVQNSGSQSQRSLNRQRQDFQAQRQQNYKRSPQNDKKTFSGSKSCWFNFLVIAIILLILFMDLSSRSSQLQEQPDTQTYDKVRAEPQDQNTYFEEQQDQIMITKAERKVNKQQEQTYQEAKQKYEQRKQKESEQKRKNDEQQTIQKECTNLSKEVKRNFFFLYLDRDQMPKQQADRFHAFNERYCHFHILYEVDFDYIIDIWNFREKQITERKQYINKTIINKEDKKMLFIFLQQYFWGGMYVHTSLGLNFGNYLSDRFIHKARLGKEVLFGQADRQNDKGILLPKKKSRAIRVEYNFSEGLEKMIRKIINHQDWRDVCSNYQCAIMKKAIQNF